MIQGSIFDTYQRDEFMSRLKAGDKIDCPCCRRYAQIYRRQVQSSNASQLIKLFRLTQPNFDFLHASEVHIDTMAGGGDFTKTKYWGLIEPKPHIVDEKKSSGFWRLTDKGAAFVRKEITIKKYAIIFDDNVLEFDGEDVDIKACLSEKFSYESLIAG